MSILVQPVRVKTFATEVVSRFAFLVDEYGFIASEIWNDYRPLYPVMITVTYTRASSTIETSLVLAYGVMST
jgi:hypothetical protein